MNVPIINVPIEPVLALVIGILIFACTKATKLSRGRVSDCRRYTGADASITSRDEAYTNSRSYVR